MRTSWHDIWGSARGPARALAPQTRIVCGASAFAACMVAPAKSYTGVAAVALVVATWAALVRPPFRVVRSALLLGLVLFLPYFLLVPLIHDGDGWAGALEVPWTVFFRGVTAMQATVCTAAALSGSALRQGLSRLPVPRVFSTVLVQIVHQTAGLVYETRRVIAAISVRGGTTGLRTAVRVLASLPRVWLPRVVERAERVGAAMELRGYCERDLAEMGVVSSSAADHLAMGLGVAVVAGAVALRIWGGP
jgi:energy-coupling factor transporter transmembrane protein EcfT